MFADWTSDNCVCFRELIVISAKNNENAIFIIKIQPSEVYSKSGEKFLFTEIQFNINDSQLITQLLEVYANACGSDC